MRPPFPNQTIKTATRMTSRSDNAYTSHQRYQPRSWMRPRISFRNAAPPAINTMVVGRVLTAVATHPTNPNANPTPIIRRRIRWLREMVSRSLSRCSRPVASSFQPRILDASEGLAAALSGTVTNSAFSAVSSRAGLASLDCRSLVSIIHPPRSETSRGASRVSRGVSVWPVLSQRSRQAGRHPVIKCGNAGGHDSCLFGIRNGVVHLCFGGTMRTYVTLSGVIATTLAVAACTEGIGSRGRAPVSLALSTGGATAAAAAQAGGSETFTDGTNTLVISSVEVVLRKVELKRADAAEPAGCAMSTSGITASDDGECGEQNDELEAGPVLVALPLGGIERTFTADVPAGSFDALEFQIHKLSSDGDAADQDFLKAHPDFAGISIRVKGTFDGADFTYTSDLDVQQELQFEQPVVVEAGKPASVTIKLDLDGWFRNGGGTLLDPATAATGAANESLVRDNIVRSFHAFQDDDEDGMDDGHEGHDGGH